MVQILSAFSPLAMVLAIVGSFSSGSAQYLGRTSLVSVLNLPFVLHVNFSFHMLKAFVLLLSLLSTAAVCAHASDSDVADDLPTIGELYRSYIAANGGLTNMQKLQSVRIRAECIDQNDAKFSFVLYKKEPNLYRSKLEIGKMEIDIIFDGENAWNVTTPNFGDPTISQLTGEALLNAKSNSQMHGPFFYLKGRTDWAKVVREEMVNERAAYLIEVSPNAGLKCTQLWLSTEHFQEVRIRNVSTDSETGETTTVDSYLSDFSQLSGVWFAQRIEIFTNEQFVNKIDVIELKANVGVFDSFFSQPKAY